MKKKISDADSAALMEIHAQVQDAEKDLQVKRDAFFQQVEDLLSEGYSLLSISDTLGIPNGNLHTSMKRFRARK